MLRVLALLATPVAVSATAGALGGACKANDVCDGDASLVCRADTAGAKKCRCKANMVGISGTQCSAALTKTTMTAGNVSCKDAGFAEGNKNVASGDFLENARCKGDAKVSCVENAALVSDTGKCALLSAIETGTEVSVPAANDAGADGTAASKLWALDDLDASKQLTTATTKKYVDCVADKYATTATAACAAKADMRTGGACYVHAKATVNAATIAGKNMRCMIASGTSGAGKLACLATHVDNKADSADACVAPAFKGTCDSASAGTPSSTATTSTKNTYALPTGYICPKVAVDAVAGVSEAQAVDALACAATHVPCQGANGSTAVTCETKTACDAKTAIRLGGYCSVDANCTRDVAGTAAVTTNTGKCRVNEKTAAKVCSCVKGLKQDGTNCLAAGTITDAIATANVCYNGTASINGVTLKSLQVFGTGMTCSGAADAGVIACDATSSLDRTTGALKLGYMLNAAGSGCSQWNGDISKAQACKTDVDYTAFAKNAECKGATMGCPTTGNTTICAMNKAMCGKAPTDTVKSTCLCPFAMHKAAKSDDPDFDDKACIATIVGATCSAVPAETFPASNPSTSYACTSTKIACATTHLECKNAGPMKGRCIAKALISGTVADQTAANLAKAYKVCPTTKAPTTAAPSAASGLAIPALAALVAIAFA